MDSDIGVSQPSIEAEVQHGDASTRYKGIGVDCSRDYTNEFTMHQIFESKVALLQWIHTTGKKNNCVIVIKRFDLANWGNKKRKPKIRFCCESSGKYRKFKGRIKMGGEDIRKFQAYLYEIGIGFVNANHFVQALLRKIAAALPRMETLSSTKQEDMVDVNLRSTSGDPSQLQAESGCAC